MTLERMVGYERTYCYLDMVIYVIVFNFCYISSDARALRAVEEIG